MTFDLQAAREICIKLGLRYPARTLINDDYQCALAAEMLPAALDRIEELEATLIEERARRICHTPTDTVGHWPLYEQVVVDEAKSQLQTGGKL